MCSINRPCHSGLSPPRAASLPGLPQTAFFGVEEPDHLGHTWHRAQRAWALTYALRVTACPGAVDRAVSAEQARGVVAFPALVDDGAGEAQAVTERDSGVAWSPGVPTRDH